MDRFLIKIGKMWSMIRQEGLFNSTRRIIKMLRILFKFTGEGEILIITSGIGDSALYRGFHVAEELIEHDFSAKTTTQDNPFLLKSIDKFDVFVLHRVTCSQKIKKFINLAKEKNKTVLYETDDLTFDAKHIKNSNAFENMNSFEKTQYDKKAMQCILEEDYIEYATTTTNKLSRHLKRKNKNVFVVPNKLSKIDVKVANEIVQKDYKKSDNEIVIGYFSGSASHDRDFSIVSDAIIKIFEEYKQVKLFVGGPVSLGDKFNKFSDRIIRKHYTQRHNHFENVAFCDINIAPLEIGDDFCESKSEIKFTEAGLLQTVTIASATEVFKNAIENGKNGFLAETGEDWYKFIKKLIENKELRINMAKEARKTILNKYLTTSDGNKEYYDFLRQKIDASFYENIEGLKKIKKEVDTAVIIANWNGKKYLETCIKALKNQSDKNFCIILVDNGSKDGSLEYLKKKHADVSLIALKENTGFAHANNVGIRAAFSSSQIKYIITLNNDTDLDKHYIKILRQYINNSPEKIVALQPKVLNFYNKDKIDATGVLTSIEMSAINRGKDEKDLGQYDSDTEIFGPSASAALYRRSMLKEIKLSRASYFDKDYFAYYEDVDLAWRFHIRGFESRFVSNAIVYHVHSATGQNFSPFKAFHIHRNHYYNIIKNAPFFILIFIMLFMIPIRYILLVSSVLKGKGASSKLKEGISEKKQDGIVKIVFKSWIQILKQLPKLLRKRKQIQANFVRSHAVFCNITKKHYAKLRKIVFG